MIIQKTTHQDLDRLLEIFEIGRQIQIQTGNTNQWYQGYPGRPLLESDIDQGVSYLVISQSDPEFKDEIIGSFALFSTPDPTYTNIQGAWLNDLPYHTIHRLVSSGQVKGVGSFILDWVTSRCDNVRVDTHEKNLPVRRLMDKFNFKYCGEIILDSKGKKRLAYHYYRGLDNE